MGGRGSEQEGWVGSVRALERVGGRRQGVKRVGACSAALVH